MIEIQKNVEQVLKCGCCFNRGQYILENQRKKDQAVSVA